MNMIFQVIGTSVSVINVLVFLYYFLLTPIDTPQYITNNLYHFIDFRVIVTYILTIQSILYIFYFLRFRVIKLETSITGISFVVLSYIGWCVCASIYTDPTHIISFGTYVAGIAAYWVVLYMLDKVEHIVEKQNYVFIIAAVVFILFFCVLNLMDNHTAFIYEHMAMIFYNCATVFFFLHHDPNPFILFET